jgi:hypothetical protein
MRQAAGDAGPRRTPAALGARHTRELNDAVGDAPTAPGAITRHQPETIACLPATGPSDVPSRSADWPLAVRASSPTQHSSALLHPQLVAGGNAVIHWANPRYLLHCDSTRRSRVVMKRLCACRAGHGAKSMSAKHLRDKCRQTGEGARVARHLCTTTWVTSTMKSEGSNRSIILRSKLVTHVFRMKRYLSSGMDPAKGGSSGWTRTSNPPVNSRMLCH